jgi:type III secretory pathway lipoprotein EscJ
MSIYGRHLMLKPMPECQGLSEIQADILLTIWKLRGVGTNRVGEDKVKAEVIDIAEEDFRPALATLQTHGFIDNQVKEGRSCFSLTPLGVAILRKTEEDRLQELK